MEFQNDLQGWLNRFNCPAFSVKENIITACNHSAEALLLSPGMDIRELLMTGSEEYAGFRSGCLYLKLNLSSKGCGASVTKEADSDLFLLDQEPEDADLRSLALAARELRNPLSNIIIAADRLSAFSREDPAVQELLARINRGLNQMHRLVNNMSDAAKSNQLSDAGMHNWRILMHEIFEKIQTQLCSTNVTLTYEDLEEDIYGYANANQLARSVLNVISNAMKFMPEGGNIHAKLARQKNMLHLSILDSGSGIADNVLTHVFSRYQRQPGIEDSRYGIGLGMVLIRSAAADHGGTVLIDRPDGKGTRVTITLAIRNDSLAFKQPPMYPFYDNSSIILRELSDSLPWELYKKD